MTPDSALGFGPADWFEFVLAGLLVCSALLVSKYLQRLPVLCANRQRVVMWSLFLIPIALRLLLLPRHPVPIPAIYDEFSHLLEADTLLHFRLANPPHPLHRFFETFFVLQEPTYSSIYPVGQGLLLAVGKWFSGDPWTGVLLATGALCAACYWALLGYVSTEWALVGGLLAIAQFGPLNLWMNCYWGGSLAATAGCLVFGSLPRLLSEWRTGRLPRKRDAAALGVGIALHLITRPFETSLLVLCVLLFALIFLRDIPNLRPVLISAGVALLAVSPALVLSARQNKAVTGSWITLPEQLSQFQYGVPTTLTIQSRAKPHRELTPEQALEYRSQFLTHGPGTDTFARFVQRFEYRIRDYRFFFSPPLYVALIGFLFTLRRRNSAFVAGCLAIFALGTNLFPYLLVHYLAAVTVLFVLVSLIGLQQISRIRIFGTWAGREIATIILLLTFGQFVFWYSLHLFEGERPELGLLQFETWDFINHRMPDEQTTNPRLVVRRELAAIPGKALVLVRYGPHHIFQNEWIWNAADIDASRVVFARDLGESADREIIRYYPDRKVLYLDPDTRPPQLSPEPSR